MKETKLNGEEISYDEFSSSIVIAGNIHNDNGRIWDEDTTQQYFGCIGGKDTDKEMDIDIEKSEDEEDLANWEALTY